MIGWIASLSLGVVTLFASVGVLGADDAAFNAMSNIHLTLLKEFEVPAFNSIKLMIKETDGVQQLFARVVYTPIGPANLVALDSV